MALNTECASSTRVTICDVAIGSNWDGTEPVDVRRFEAHTVSKIYVALDMISLPVNPANIIGYLRAAGLLYLI